MAVILRNSSILVALLVLVIIVSLLHSHKHHLPSVYNQIVRDDARPDSNNYKFRKILTKVRIRNEQSKFYSRLSDVHQQYEYDPVLPSNTKLSQLYTESKGDNPDFSSSVTSHTKNSKDSVGDISSKPFENEKTNHNDHPDFLTIDNEDRVFVYSAHYDYKTAIVKIVALGPMSDDTDYLSDYHCVVVDKSGGNETVPLDVYYHISTYSPWTNQKYDSYIYSCEGRFNNPDHILLTNTETSTPVSLPVLYEPTSGEGHTYKFAVCVEPLVSNFNDTKAIKHFIAANTMYGAERFYFYLSVASQPVTDMLTTLPMVVVYPWRLGDLLGETHAAAQKAVYAHCLQTHRQTAHYLAFIDIDEILVPREHNSWDEMVTRLETENPLTGAMVFQSKLFVRDLLTDLQNATATSKFIKDNQILSLSATKTVGVFDLYQWSKVMVDTSRTDVMDIHKVRQMYTGYEALNVKPDIGVVHHYRHYDISKDEVMTDNHMNKVIGQLLNSYQKLFSYVSKK